MWFLVQVLLIKLLYYYFTSLVCEMSDEGWEKKKIMRRKRRTGAMAYTGPFLCASLCLSYLNVLTHLSPTTALWGVY